MSNNISVNETPGPSGRREVREPLTLALDTATAARSVALVSGARLLAARTRTPREAGASSVLLDIDETLRAAGASLREVELFAAAIGPGSFTGIRAGLATIKALAAATKRPVVGVQTLAAVAHAMRPAERVLALLPAGRGELFAQLLSAEPDGAIRELSPAEHIAPQALLERGAALGGGLKWACWCAQEFAASLRAAGPFAGIEVRAAEEVFEEAAAGEWLVTESCGGLAAAVASLARLSLEDAAEPEQLRPLYVRASDAELKEECRAPNL
jgi:tRNA threonylcarbamoyladenosine biosynthesis protein TsaB